MLTGCDFQNSSLDIFAFTKLKSIDFHFLLDPSMTGAILFHVMSPHPTVTAWPSVG
jgi:hypothetical protein